MGLADRGLASGFWREQQSVVVLIDEERIEAFVRHLATAGMRLRLISVR